MKRRWRNTSIFGDGPRATLDREQRARFRFLVRSHARSRRLSAKASWVAEALLKRLGADGQCDPSQDTLAADAGCAVRTVRRALSTLRRLGLVTWVNRLVRNGWRVEQSSNAYRLSVNTPLYSGGQIGRETKKKVLSICRQVDPVPDDEAARQNAARQLRLLGAPVPASWGMS
jgi:DNA-binding FadR family transcriptional regulator